MKKFVSFYVLVALVWALAATIFGPGTGFFYHLGRNLPGAFVWPVSVVKSPYTLYTWATGHKRTEIFQNAHNACEATYGNTKYCDCATDLLENDFTEEEFRAVDALIRQGTPSPKFSSYLVKAVRECR